MRINNYTIYIKNPIKHLPILLLCMAMFISISACNSDNEEQLTPQTPLDDASLLESQMELIRTKTAEATSVIMVTTKKEVEIAVRQTSTIVVDWGDGANEIITITNDYHRVSNIYTDNLPVHTISFYSTSDALIELDCSYEELIFLEISKNINLSELSCSGNRLSDLDVSKNIKLEAMFIGNNLLSSIDITNNPLLTYLDCLENKLLTSLDVSKNINLTDLTFDHCNISSMDVSNHNQLEVINCDGNPLNTLNITGCDSLNTITCDPTPFAADFNLVLNMVAALPDRVGKQTGRLFGITCPNKDLIKSIGTVKNWVIY